MSEIKISPYSKVKVQWNDRPENYSREAKSKVANHFAKKYGVARNNVNVVYTAVRLNDKGETVEITGANMENIMDANYQRALMKEWIARENKNVDFDRILKLDDLVNAELNLENNCMKRNSWSIKWITINNFLSFGEENVLNLNKLKGLTVVNSVPANQGGKTNLTIDAMKFLLHGNTTKTDKNEQIFNTYSNKNELVVRGMLELDDDEVIIERKLKRSQKKTGEWNVTNKVNFYRILPDGDEELLNEEDAIRTTKKIKESIGAEKDFEMLVLATENNLDDLIGLTSTESGKVLTRLIGLEVMELKEAAVRKMYNEFDKKKKSNQYNVVSLETEIEEHTQALVTWQETADALDKRLDELRTEIITLGTENDRLLSSKITVDVTISALNPSKLETEIQEITEKGVALKNKIAEFNTKLDELGKLVFDEDEHHALTSKQNITLTNMQIKGAEVRQLEVTIQDLIEGGICKACNRQLDDVDNTEHIQNHRDRIEKATAEIDELSETSRELAASLLTLNQTKILVDSRNKLELDRDRVEVEMGSLRNKIVEKKNDLKKYKLNQEAIEFNRNVDAEVTNVKTKLAVANYAKDDVTTKLATAKSNYSTNETNIVTKTKLIEQINKEAQLDKIYKIYIELVGKKGISKLVLRSVLPIINAQCAQLLDEVCDFEVEIFIDDKNDLQFHLIKDGITKLLKSGSGFEKTASCLVLRGVLGKLSTLPMPNFITFDEVLGKVANENLDKLRPLFEKIKTMYDIVFLITHNDLVKDWGDNVITVVKSADNISKITVK